MNKLQINESVTTITNDSSDVKEYELLEKLREYVPAIHSNRRGNIHKVSSRYLKDVLRVFRGIQDYTIEDVPQGIKKILEDNDRRDSATASLMLNSFKEGNDFLRPHQRRARELAKIHSRYAFYYDTRTGKTPMSLQIIADDLELNPSHKWLIVCPLVLINNAWLEDAKKFFPNLKVQSLHATKKADRLKAFKTNANVYVQNIESFASYREFIDELGIHGVFVDESSTMKSHSSKQSKALVDFSQTVKRWYLLSGTPASNGEQEYYMQLKSIDKYLVPSSYTQFEMKYFNNISFNPQFKVLKMKSELDSTFKKLVSTVAIYVDKADVLNLPARVFDTVQVKMPERVNREFDTMRKKLYVELKEDEIITAQSEASKVNKLRQISSGFIYNEEAKPTLISMFKFNALKELLDSFGNEQVLVFANYKYEFEIIAGMLGDNCRIINSTVDINYKNNAIADFKAKKLQYLIVNPAALSMGVTLTNCHICVYFSLDYSYERYYQSRDRIYADKSIQPKDCRYYFVQSVPEKGGSMDAVILETVNNKGSMSASILNYLKGGV